MGWLKTYYKHNILKTHNEWESHFGNMMRLLNKNLKSFKPLNLLDVGCGDGERTLRLAKSFNMAKDKVFGLELNNEYVKLCSEKFNVEMVDLEVDLIPFNNNKFDIVICNQVLEHLKNYKKVLSEIIRVTNLNGYIFIGIPNLAHLINRYYLLFGNQPMCIDLNSSHVRAFTHNAFVNILLSIENIRFINCEGSLMYPLPYQLGNWLCRYFIGLSGYTGYLLKKID